MSELLIEECAACNGQTPKLTSEQANELLAQLEDGWEIVEGHHLKKRWAGFKDFLGPCHRVAYIAETAERESHHPEIRFGWGFVEVTIWTHAIGGLSRNDFILAAKIDNLPSA